MLARNAVSVQNCKRSKVKNPSLPLLTQSTADWYSPGPAAGPQGWTRICSTPPKANPLKLQVALQDKDDSWYPEPRANFAHHHDDHTMKYTQAIVDTCNLRSTSTAFLETSAQERTYARLGSTIDSSLLYGHEHGINVPLEPHAHVSYTMS